MRSIFANVLLLARHAYIVTKRPSHGRVIDLFLIKAIKNMS